ncbi:unnamed protein product [Discosporangium mesarthrocarpum]
MSQNKRKGWDAAVQAVAGHAPARKEKKRASGRTVVISKSLRVVDDATRKMVKDARLEALEADNYNEAQEGEQDDEYNLDEDDDRAERHKARRTKGGAGAGKGKKGKKEGRWRHRNFKSIHQVLYELTGELSTYPGGATALSIDAPESKLPPRHFCPGCGYYGLYSCPRCGTRFCGTACLDHHKERCMKFSA